MGLSLRRGVGATALSVLSALAWACGPSFQAVYEGNSRFEHCYALEENPQASMRDKANCWRDWSDHYTYGQTRDRIQYAIARYVALSQATLPTDEALMMAAPGVTPRVSTITAPTPTNAFAPPPKVLEENRDSGTPLRPSEAPVVLHGNLADAAPSTNAPPTSNGPPPPGSACTEGCGRTFQECQGAPCAEDAGSAACRKCERTYKTCMRGCFR